MEENLNQLQILSTPEPKKSPKYLILIFVIVGIAVAGYFTFAKSQNWWPFGEKKEDVICIQVITPARNPKTGEVRDFSTPCDVTEGWEKIEPETIY